MNVVAGASPCTSFLDPLRSLAGAGFVERVPGVDVAVERDEALRRLQGEHRRQVRERFGAAAWWRAEQVHGHGVGVVGVGEPSQIAGVDALVTRTPGQVLGIYVADCGPIWLADRASGAVGVVHSGRRGTEEEILGATLDRMALEFGTRPEDVVGVLGPCIRPPHYETDFAAEIGGQAEACGLGEFHDCGLDTAADLSRYYSYRMEKGRTGRMLALITTA